MQAHICVHVCVYVCIFSVHTVESRIDTCIQKSVIHAYKSVAYAYKSVIRACKSVIYAYKSVPKLGFTH